MSALPRLAAVVAPVVAASVDVDDELRDLEAVAQDLTGHTLSANTQRAYAKAWRSFGAFCEEYALDPLPAHPETVRWYVAWMSVQHTDEGLPRFSAATIRQHLAGVAEKHLSDGLLDPTSHRGVTSLVSGLVRLRATRPVRKRPLLLDDVVRIIQAMDHDIYPAGISAARDTLAIWLGFAGALRRSEAAALTMNSLELNVDDGVHVHVGKSKTDQMNDQADVVVLPYGSSPLTCPPCALHRWVALVRAASQADERASNRSIMAEVFSYQLDEHVCGTAGSRALISTSDLMSDAPLLRATYRNQRSARIHDRGVLGDALHTMLQARMTEAGMNPEHYGFHSLRAGFVTQARRGGADTTAIRRQTRHTTDRMVDVYDREWLPMRHNGVTTLGL